MAETLERSPPHHWVRRDSLWRHYKGGVYIVLCLAAREADHNQLDVIYKDVDTGRVWSRPLANWREEVSDGTKTIPRFRQVSREVLDGVDR